MTAPRRRVYVEWLDSYTSTGWREVEALDAEPLVCYSLGYLHDTGDGIVIAAHLGGDEARPHQVCGAMTIPRTAILRYEELPTSSGSACEPEPSASASACRASG